jgi:Na+-translocating ferredoxin:NAD+ oxidoreductase RnfD subunit
MAPDMTARSIAVGSTSYPLVLPNIRDPRLHVAAVIITVHVLGQVGLHFRVSVPQILAAILTTAIIEIALTFRTSRAFVWPASAMLTGSGVALILRVIGTPPDQPWYTGDWWVFAGVAAFSLLTKYVIKYRGSHVFNPSNIGLVVAFLVLGSQRVEPLDFWWGPLTIWLAIAYTVIVGGGLLITRRLKLLGLAATFWLTLAVGIGLLAGSGHCMTANWAFSPVCGVDFWRVIVTSPEVLIFLFFMITDPKTTPGGRVGRIVFGFLVAVVGTLLVAPQTNEFGTKVALLSGLVAVCAFRPLLDRVLPEPKSAADELRGFATRLATGGGGAGHGAVRGAGRLALALVLVLALGVGIVAAGAPARLPVYDTATVLSSVPHQVDPATFPPITIGQDVTDWNHTIEGQGARDIVVTMAENLEIENQAVLRRDPSILGAVDHGDRLAEMQDRIASVAAAGDAVIRHYRFDSLKMALVIPFGMQTGLSLGVTGTGQVTEDTYDAAGGLVGSRTVPFERTFILRRATGDRWLNVGVRPEEQTP